jgi:hypothetical protein
MTRNTCPGLDPGPLHTRSLERSRHKAGTSAELPSLTPPSAAAAAYSPSIRAPATAAIGKSFRPFSTASPRPGRNRATVADGCSGRSGAPMTGSTIQGTAPRRSRSCRNTPSASPIRWLRSTISTSPRMRSTAAMARSSPTWTRSSPRWRKTAPSRKAPSYRPISTCCPRSSAVFRAETADAACAGGCGQKSKDDHSDRPALRRSSAMRSACALLANRCSRSHLPMVKPGSSLSTSPAAVLASSSRPERAAAAASQT